MQCTTKVVDGYGQIMSAHKQTHSGKCLLVNLPLLHVFVKLLLLLLWFGKELDLAHNKDIALQKKTQVGKLLSIFTPHNPKASQVDPNAILFPSTTNSAFLGGTIPR
jgi:hypothetical protein